MIARKGLAFAEGDLRKPIAFYLVGIDAFILG